MPLLAPQAAGLPCPSRGRRARLWKLRTRCPLRGAQVYKLRGNPAHPFAKFGTGNKATLRDEASPGAGSLRDRLLDFYARHYSANQVRGTAPRQSAARGACASFATHPARRPHHDSFRAGCHPRWRPRVPALPASGRAVMAV